ncbi:MAG: glycosyltransferase family 39 protein [Acidimicrobiales bacterium]|nr:glycosyltransferase family 39 protein [Acidimicrobiales bacterium]
MGTVDNDRSAVTPGLLIVLVMAVASGLALRFIAMSPMWLDEAISASLAEEARVGWSALVDALRQDGHPPLYYVLLAAWSVLFGASDGALRAFSGMLGVLSIPLTWLIARRYLDTRGCLLVVGVLASSPFAVRYATEVRMYSLLLLLLLVLHLVVVRLWERPSVGRSVALAVTVAALLLTHYWALFAVAVLSVGVAVAWRCDRRRGWHLFCGLVAGWLAFVPWLPVFLDQLAHTGTPWSPAPRPTVVAALTLEAYGGGRGSEALLVVVVLSALVVVGLGSRTNGGRPVLGWTNLRWLQVTTAFGVGTLVVGAGVSLATDTAYQGRYGVFALVPLVLACGVGLRRMTVRASTAGLAVLVLLSGVSVARELSRDRTQVGQISTVVRTQGAPGDVVLFCPDQLAPVGHRLLADRFVTLSYPGLDDGRRVNWVDYVERNRGVDVEMIADAVVTKAVGTTNVWLAWMDGYETFDGQCPQLRLALADRLGQPYKSVYADSDAFYDAANLSRFPGPP